MLRIFRYHPPTRSARPPGEHLLVFDGDCAFCLRSAVAIQKRSRTPLTLITFAELSRHDLLTSLDQDQFLLSAHYITPEGNEYHGGESITRARGKVREKEGRFIYPIMHPAAALHRQENKSIIIQDFKEIPAVLEKLARTRSGAPVIEPVSPEAHQPEHHQPEDHQEVEASETEQLDLFSATPARESTASESTVFGPQPAPIPEPVAPTTQQLSLF